MKNYDPTKFRKELQQVDWESIIELNDVNAMSLEWEKEFIRVYRNMLRSANAKYELFMRHTLTKNLSIKCLCEIYTNSVLVKQKMQTIGNFIKTLEILQM